MNTALQTAINQQLDATRQADANCVYELLRTAHLQVEVRHDGRYTVTGGAIRCQFVGDHAEITFPDPYGPSTLIVTAPYLATAVATVMEALMRKLATKPSGMDGQWCCGRAMYQADPELWFFPNEPVQVLRVHRCMECDRIVKLDVTDAVEAASLAAGVTRR